MRPPFAEVVQTGASTLRGRTLSPAHSKAGTPVFAGNLVAIDGVEGRTIGVIRSAYWRTGPVSGQDENVEFDVELLGRLGLTDKSTWQFSRGVSRLPAIGAEISELDQDALEQILPSKSETRIGIGTIDPLRSRELAIDLDPLLRTHFAIFGATGSGKTSAVIAILRGLLAALPHSQVVILDPHGEYRGCLGDMARIWDRHTLRLPYWLLRFRELAAIFKFMPESSYPAEIKILRDAVMESKRRFAKEGGQGSSVRLSLDAPVPYKLSDLRAVIYDRMSELKRAEPVPSYVHVLNRLEELTQDERFAFMFSPGYAHDMLTEVIGQILASAGTAQPIAILDLSEIPDDALDVIVASVARLLLSLANWASPDGGIPALLICEESSRYMSAFHEGEGRLAVGALAQIAREGRKYGISLGVLSQRPSQLSAEIVSQCGSIFVLRTSNQHDLEFIARALPESAGALVEMMPALATGEAIAFGQAVPFPMKFQLPKLPADMAPKPKAMEFSVAWKHPGRKPELVARAIARWREHGHLFHR